MLTFKFRYHVLEPLENLGLISVGRSNLGELIISIN